MPVDEQTSKPQSDLRMVSRSYGSKNEEVRTLFEDLQSVRGCLL
jgi:hypothetical protein